MKCYLLSLFGVNSLLLYRDKEKINKIIFLKRLEVFSYGIIRSYCKNIITWRRVLYYIAEKDKFSLNSLGVG